MQELKQVPANLLRKCAVFVDGEPVLAYAYTKQHFNTIYTGALAVMYEPKYVRDSEGNFVMKAGEEQFVGMTKLEVGAHRMADRYADGDLDAGKEIFDRILGKPKQQTENVNYNITVQEMLDSFDNGRPTVVVDPDSVVEKPHNIGRPIRCPI